MLIFLYGPDTYRSRQKLKEIISSYQEVHRSGLNLKYLPAENLDFSALADGLKQASMFQEKKLTILTGLFSNSQLKKDFLEEGKSLADSEDITVVYEEEKVSKRDSLFKFFKKHSKLQEFKLLKNDRLQGWARREIKKLQGSISEPALKKLVHFVGNDLWRMTNEIKKLVNFKRERKIEEKDINLLVKPKIEADIFKTIDAIASKDKKRALHLLKSHLEKGDSPLYLFSMINFQFRNLLIVKDLLQKGLSPFRESKLHPFVVKKSCSLSRKFQIRELKKIYQKIFEVDLDIKTGRVKPEVGLDLLIAGI